MQYYFLATSLPELRIEAPIDLSYGSLLNLMNENLIAGHWKEVEVLRRYYDIENIRAFWTEEPFQNYGNYNPVDLEECLISRLGLPMYVYDFIDKYDSMEARLERFPELFGMYFRYETENSEGFLRQYLNFEREWRLVFAAFRAKAIGKDITEELQFESSDDDLVMQIIAQKDSKTYTPPYQYSDLKPVFDSHHEQPLELHKHLCAYRFEKVADFVGLDLFSLDTVLAYMVQLIIAERWVELDKQTGIEIIDRIVKEAS